MQPPLQAIMDLVRILRSLEEFLYELISFMVFYPRTLIRIIANPVGVAKHTHIQLGRAKDQQSPAFAWVGLRIRTDHLV